MAGAGWRQWTRERLTSDLLQTYVQDQTVMRFASASARSAAIAAPAQGMVSTLNDTPNVLWQADAGGVWRPFYGGSTPWTALAIGAPVVAGSEGAEFQVVGAVVEFRIHAVHNNAWSSGYPLCTFPVGARPSRKVWFDGQFYGSVDRRLEVNISTDGVFRTGRAVPADSPGMVVSGTFIRAL